jgi:mono/diheme cytochrome c family protein
MISKVNIGLAVAGILAILAGGGAAFIGSGVYNIGADDHHTKPVLAIIETLRERSIGVRVASIAVPRLKDRANIAAGAARYSTLCVGCHLAPGVTKSDLRSGLYPHPPNLAQEDIRDPRRAFWTIKHGIGRRALPSTRRNACWSAVPPLPVRGQSRPAAADPRTN